MRTVVLSEHMDVHQVHTGARGEHQDALGLELSRTVNHHVGNGTELGFSGTAEPSLQLPPLILKNSFRLNWAHSTPTTWVAGGRQNYDGQDLLEYVAQIMQKNKFITQEIPFILKKKVLFSDYTLQGIYILVMKTIDRWWKRWEKESCQRAAVQL